jgi:hypothetical protein
MNSARLAPPLLLLLLMLGSTRAAVATSPAAAAGADERTNGVLAPASDGVALSFSGSGFLGLFETGVLAQLQELGLASRATPVTGTSGGALVAIASCLNLSPDSAKFVAEALVAHCRPERSCAGGLDRAVRAMLALAVDKAAAEALVTSDEEKDALVRERCSGVATAVMTRVLARGGDPTATTTTANEKDSHSKETEAWHVSDFASVADLVGAGASSSYIPFFSGAAGTTAFRGARVMDGGFTEMLPPCSPSARKCVRVSAVPSGSPVFPGLPAPPADAEIAPGKYSALPLGMTPSQWGAYALATPSEGLEALMLQHGREQALGWAREAYPELMMAGGAAAAAAAGEEANGAGGSRRKGARRSLLSTNV